MKADSNLAAIVAAIRSGQDLRPDGAGQFVMRHGERVLWVIQETRYAECRPKSAEEPNSWVFDRIRAGTLAITNKRLIFQGEWYAEVEYIHILGWGQVALTAGRQRLVGLAPEIGTSARHVFAPPDLKLFGAIVDAALELATASKVRGPREDASIPAEAGTEPNASSTKKPIGSTVSSEITPPDSLPTFSDVGGMEDLKQQLRATVGLLLEKRDEAAALGIKFNGVLLYGPPGTGKTYIARACAGEFRCNFMSVGSADIVSAYVGDSPRLVAATFDAAKTHAPSILFFDEFDALASRRAGGSAGAGDAAMRQVLEQLLRNLEEVRDRPDVIVMAATNRFDDLDPAIVRPGRFDLKVRVDMPDLEARRAIFIAALANRSSQAIDYDALARATDGVSAAGIRAIVDAAALAALQASDDRRSPVVTMDDLNDALAQRGGKDRPLAERVGWDSVVLADETKRELQKIQVLIQDPSRAALFGIKPPRGVLLYGPPGTGKTSIARVLASETKASFYPVSCGDLISKWLGESESNIAQLFSRARENRPSIIFLDEIDALARRRGSAAGDAAFDRVVNQLLQEMDGLQAAQGVFVLAATNRREIIDEALLRGGRLGRQIFVGLPDQRGREALLRQYTASMPLAPDVSVSELAIATPEWSPADIRQLAEQAAMEAMMSSTTGDRPGVRMADFARALSTIRPTPDSSSTHSV